MLNNKCSAYINRKSTKELYKAIEVIKKTRNNAKLMAVGRQKFKFSWAIIEYTI
jgi:isocitrate dehydrogenase